MSSVFTPELVSTAAALWSEGLTASQIAKRLGVSRNGVIGVASRNRQLFPGRGEGAAEKEQKDLAEVELLWAAGRTQVEIAEVMGRSASSIHKIIKSWPDRFPKRSKKEVLGDYAVQVQDTASIPPPRRKPKPSAFSPIAGLTPMLLWEAPANACRWPVSTSDNPEKAVCLHVCGDRAAHGPYCSHHARLSTGPGTAPERNADRLLLVLGSA
ncbi:GcrA family cell cycle regulator [Aureimonas ureilytica]|uniref:GcrA family cell cycle regulator n=1 Tax=Aureimonas ureilytica TaxID=401562 RepID=UPI000375977C|nr:GcrA family cell cycle regulator [Aureimonas ureilytica]